MHTRIFVKFFHIFHLSAEYVLSLILQCVLILFVHSHIVVAMEILWVSCVLVVLSSVDAAHSHTGSQGITEYLTKTFSMVLSFSRKG